MMKLLTLASAKTQKGEKYGYLTAILYLKPSDSSGIVNLCPAASPGCKAACLNTAGRGKFNVVQAARQRKTELFVNDRKTFMNILQKDIDWLVKKAKKEGLIPCVRLNGTSDIPRLDAIMAKNNPDVQFYGYTKIPRPYERTERNYHLTFSRSEINDTECQDAIENGINVAVVFESLPDTFWGRPVVNGDDSDLRFLDNAGSDGKGVIVGLTPKGRGIDDPTGFVIRNEGYVVRN